MDYITEDKWYALCGYNYWPGIPIPESANIFCKTDFVVNCLRIMGRGPGPYTLVTGRSDHAITDGAAALAPKSLKKWFSVNVDTDNPAVSAVPLGLAASQLPHGQSELLAECYVAEKTCRLLAFYATNTHRERGEILNKVRAECVDMTFGDFMEKPLSYRESLEVVARAQFVLCPRGNGYDTHRVWESLYLGSVPIVKRCMAMNHFADMGILFVDDWAEVTDELLDGHVKSAMSPKLGMGYWRERLMA